MKITFALSIMLSIAISFGYGQEYKKIRVGVGLGYAKAGGAGASGGSLWTIEPGYRINDKIVANIRVEIATVVRGTVGDTGFDSDVAAIQSYTLNGQHYFRSSRFRPFAGIGFGIYRIGAINLNPANSGTTVLAPSDTKLGLYPRIGFDAGHFTFSLDYNLVGNTLAKMTTANGQPTSTELKNSYLGLRLGGYFGGGKKQPFKNALLH